MWQSYFNGLGLGAGLIMAIGAQNLFVLTRGLRREHPLAAALVCVLCDCLLIGAGIFGLARLLASQPLLLELARWGGALFLIGYAACALRRAWRPAGMDPTGSGGLGSRRAVLLTTLAITLLNPHVYLDTVVLLGSLGSAQPVPAAFAGGAIEADSALALAGQVTVAPLAAGDLPPFASAA